MNKLIILQGHIHDWYAIVYVYIYLVDVDDG